MEPTENIEKEDGKDGESTNNYTDTDYAKAALLLARTYKAMKAERENIRKWQTGELKYTRDNALEELISITPHGDDNLGVRVQTSNTSDQTGRLGMLLASGYVEKRQNEIMKEMLSPEMLEHIAYLDWKIDIVETAIAERMTKLQAALFKQIFVKRKTYSQLIRSNKGKKSLNKWKISTEKNKSLDAVAQEIMSDQEQENIMELMDEVRKEQEDS